MKKFSRYWRFPKVHSHYTSTAMASTMHILRSPMAPGYTRSLPRTYPDLAGLIFRFSTLNIREAVFFRSRDGLLRFFEDGEGESGVLSSGMQKVIVEQFLRLSFPTARRKNPKSIPLRIQKIPMPPPPRHRKLFHGNLPPEFQRLFLQPIESRFVVHRERTHECVRALHRTRCFRGTFQDVYCRFVRRRWRESAAVVFYRKGVVFSEGPGGEDRGVEG